MLAYWEDLGDDRVLGGAGPWELLRGDDCGLVGAPRALLTPAVANDVAGRDVADPIFGPLDFHLFMAMNSANNEWSFTTDQDVPGAADEFDLLGTVLHELAHELFFTSNDVADPATAHGAFDQALSAITATDPASNPINVAVTPRAAQRFDNFLFVGDAGTDPLVSRCDDESRFYAAQTGNNMYFVETQAALTTNFRLYAPSPYESGSSVSHFEYRDGAIGVDCVKNGIDPADPEQCSALMTPSAAAGDYIRYIGENTLRVARSIRSSAAGSSMITCKSNPVRHGCAPPLSRSLARILTQTGGTCGCYAQSTDKTNARISAPKLFYIFFDHRNRNNKLFFESTR